MNLALARSVKLPVPYTLIISSNVFSRFIRETEIAEKLSDLYDHCDESDELDIARVSKEIKLMISDTPIPDYIAEQLTDELTAFDNEKAVIRASIVPVEKTPIDESNLFHDVVGVIGLTQILSAIKNVWVSTFSLTALTRFKKAGRNLTDIQMAVLVQRYVPATNFYHLNSVDPFSGDRDQMILETVKEFWLEETTPTQKWKIDKTTQRITEINSTGDRNVHKAIKHTLRTKKPIPDDSQIKELIEMADLVERLLHLPTRLDIAIMRPTKGKGGKKFPGKIYLLQATPYTSVPKAPPAWLPPNHNSIYWRGQLADLIPGPITPLTSSLGLRVFNSILSGKDPTAPLPKDVSFPYCLINNYVYRSIPLGATTFPALMVALLKIAAAALQDPQQSVMNAGRELKQLVALERDKPLEAMDPLQLFELCRRLLYYSADYYRQIRYSGLFTAGLAQAIFIPLYELMTQKDDPDGIRSIFGADSPPRDLVNKIEDLAMKIRGTGTSEYLLKVPINTVEDDLKGEPPFPIDREEWHQLRASLSSIADDFGHLCFDLDISLPTLGQKQIALITMLRSALSRAYDGKTVRRTSEQVRNLMYANLEKGWTRLLLPLTRSIHTWAFNAARAKECALSDLSYATPLLQKAFIQLGDRLVSAEILEEANDIFWLFESELYDLVQDSDRWEYHRSKGEIVSIRKAELDADNNLQPPRYIGQRIWFRSAFKTYKRSQDGQTLFGDPVISGKYTGPARVINTSDDIRKIKQGDVLIFANLAPAWITIYGMAGAIVSNMGGVFGHTSDLSRESGVPCVLNILNVNNILRDGMIVTVDGDEGSVAILT